MLPTCWRVVQFITKKRFYLLLFGFSPVLTHHADDWDLTLPFSHSIIPSESTVDTSSVLLMNWIVGADDELWNDLLLRPRGTVINHIFHRWNYFWRFRTRRSKDKISCRVVSMSKYVCLVIARDHLDTGSTLRLVHLLTAKTLSAAAILVYQTAILTSWIRNNIKYQLLHSSFVHHTATNATNHQQTWSSQKQHQEAVTPLHGRPSDSNDSCEVK